MGSRGDLLSSRRTTEGREMEDNSNCIFRLNAFQIKIIALITMTLDHIGAYQTITSNRAINDGLRIVGRIAAPLFFFMVVEGLHHTRSKPKYILRLYTAGIVIEVTNRIISKATGTFEFGNILPTFFYTALFVFCIEYICNNRRNIKAVGIAICGLIIPFLFFALNIILLEQGYSTAWYVISLFFPSPCNVDYSILFVLLGVIWYFINNKLINCAVFAVLSLACLLIPGSYFFTMQFGWFRPVCFNVYSLFISTQWCMCLAIPFMLLYNGEKGRNLKYLFYVYYPVHVYVLFFIQIFK